MALIWTPDRIRSLANDEYSWERARRLGHAPVWRFQSGNEQLIWGECRGSGGVFFQTAVDLNAPAYTCSCPVKRMPCKHGLALLLLLHNYGDTFRVTEETPDWVERWLHSRQRKNKTRSDSPEHIAVRAKNRDKRLEGMAAGIEDLRSWLRDVMRQGIAETIASHGDPWNQIAARMVDAKLGGIGRRLRLLGQMNAVDKPFEQILETLGELYLMVSGFDRFESLSPDLQTDLLTAAGMEQRKDALMDVPTVTDHWLIVGLETGLEEQLQYRRTWLLGRHTGRKALLLDFTWGGNAFEQPWRAGMRIQASLQYFPSAYPQRAILGAFSELSSEHWEAASCTQLSEAAKGYAVAIAANPWLQHAPVLLSAVLPCYQHNQVLITDETGAAVPLNASFETTLAVLAHSAGKKINIFGEWRAGLFRPLTILQGTDFISL
jgi:hypothetical protein